MRWGAWSKLAVHVPLVLFASTTVLAGSNLRDSTSRSCNLQDVRCSGLLGN